MAYVRPSILVAAGTLLALLPILPLLGCSERTGGPRDGGVDTGIADSGPDTGVPGTCENGRRDDSETSIDCGGVCAPCADGQMCDLASDCTSGVCRSRYCLVPACTDGVQNGTETGVDCGGDCGRCMGGQPCMVGTDCRSGECLADMTCAASGCEDGERNQDETGVDCGGSLCPACGGGEGCVRQEDCLSLICDMGTCTTSSCTDRVLNQDETSIDCGGGVCDPCRDGFSCFVDIDCEGMRCVAGSCVSCMDGVQNAEETDVDCGGGLCDTCADGEMCVMGTDCTGGTCEAGACVSCIDGVLNQDESDVDCGGAICPGCGTGFMCLLGRDCLEGVCTTNICQAPTCSDGVANGLETDIDCGGTSACPRCMDGRLCPNGPSDCISPLCTSGRCGDVRGHLVLIGHDYFSTNAGADQVIGNTVLLAPETATIDVLIFDQYADRTPTGEVAMVEAAILREMTAASRTVRFTRLTDYTMLSTALTSAMDVFIVAEQELGGGTFPTIATAWESTLRTFLGSGGVVISTNYFDSGWQTLDRPMLIDIGGTGGGSGTLSVLPAASTHPIAVGVTPYSGPNGTSAYTGVLAGGAISITPIIANASGEVVVYDALF